MNRYILTLILFTETDEIEFKNKILNKILNKISYSWNYIGLKKLAYPIQNQEFGKYMEFIFPANSDEINEFENYLKIQNEILKFIIIRED